MLPKHLTQIQFPQQIESLPAKPLSAQFKWWKEERRGIITKLQNSFGSRAHVVGLAGHHHQTDPWTAGWAWGTWTAQPHHSPVQNQQGQGTRGSPKLTNTFCSARLDESCFQAPLLALPGNNTLKDLRATGEHSKSEHVCTISAFHTPALQEAWWKTWVCFMAMYPDNSFKKLQEFPFTATATLLVFTGK